MTRWLAVFCAAVTLGGPALAAEVHGETDVFSAPGVALAWGVVRGPDEARTSVVVRMIVDPAIREISVTGRDPFTREQKSLASAAPKRGLAEVRIPRASFADFPRTDWRFFTADKEPRLHVFYLGVPDTTPEFAAEAALDAYLTERLSAQTRARAGREPISLGPVGR